MTAARQVGDSSESELLAAFLPVLERHNAAVAARGARELLVGPGDDCAVLDLTRGRTVLTTDTQTEGQDYRLVWPSGYRTTGEDLGRKSAAQNLADVAAMGAVPITLVISLTLPPETTVEFLADFARGYVGGIRDLAADSCTVSGGDLGTGTELSATVTALGRCEREPVLRSGARPGDVVVLAGTTGRAAAGLSLLDSELPWRGTSSAGEDERTGAEERAGEHELEALEELAAAQLRPAPPLAAGPELAAAGARAMIDVSDGLLRDAGRIAAASGVSIDLSARRLEPLARALEPAARLLGADPWDWVLSGGEDHGILACLPVDSPLPPGARAIGFCGSLNDEGTAVTLDGRALTNLGWDHFAAADRL